MISRLMTTIVTTLIALSAVKAEPLAFAVQVTAHSSEAEARSRYRMLQALHPMLEKREAMLHRIDVGGTVLYRVDIGPFTSQQATTFCNKLKTDGWQCLVLQHRQEVGKKLPPFVRPPIIRPPANAWTS